MIIKWSYLSKNVCFLVKPSSRDSKRYEHYLELISDESLARPAAPIEPAGAASGEAESQSWTMQRCGKWVVQ